MLVRARPARINELLGELGLQKIGFIKERPFPRERRPSGARLVTASSLSV